MCKLQRSIIEEIITNVNVELVVWGVKFSSPTVGS